MKQINLSVITRAMGKSWRPSLFATMSFLMTLGSIGILLDGVDALDFVVRVPMYALLLYMLWDYTRLKFKRMWHDR